VYQFSVESDMAAARPAADAATNIEARRAALAASPLFRALLPDELDAVLRHAPLRQFGRGATVYRKGDAGSGMLVILSGRLRIGSTGEDGRDIVLGILGPGQCVGEMALLDSEERSADVTALEACTVLAVERGPFIALMRGNPDLCLRVVAMLSSRLRNSNEALEEMALLGLPRRIGRLLLRLARDYGRRADGGGIRIELKLSQKDISALVGGSREKVNRQLRRWEEEGAIGREQGYIVVRRPATLNGADRDDD
jgi:CRP/FNR family transcriptional regulator, cyclic AMP receptor protein